MAPYWWARREDRAFAHPARSDLAKSAGIANISPPNKSFGSRSNLRNNPLFFGDF
jgi:hypothetical protein